MDTSDDPIIAAATVLAPIATVAGAGVGIAGALGAFDRGGGMKAQQAQAGQPRQTAESTVQLSEQAKRNRRLTASALTRRWAEPTLGTPGLLGG